MSTEIIAVILDGERLPQRTARQNAETGDAHLLRTIATLLPIGFALVSQLGVETALGAMAEATKAAMAADLGCYLAWCINEQRPALPTDAEDLVRYLRHLEEQGRKPATLFRRMASIARTLRLVGLGERDSLPTGHAMVRNALRANRRRKASQRQAAPLRFGEAPGFTLAAPLRVCSGDAQGFRDAALLSLGYGAGLRVSDCHPGRPSGSAERRVRAPFPSTLEDRSGSDGGTGHGCRPIPCAAFRPGYSVAELKMGPCSDGSGSTAAVHGQPYRHTVLTRYLAIPATGSNACKAHRRS